MLPSGVQLADLLWDLGRFAGLTGFAFLALLIFSGDTARFFDRFFGMDRIIRFQRWFALATSIFILAHPIFFILSDRSVAAYLIPNFVVLPLAAGTLAFYFLIIVGVASVIYKRVSYQIWQYLHIFIYLLFFFGVYHAFGQGSDFTRSSVQIIYGAATLLVVVGLVYRTVYKIKQRSAGRFFVKEIRRETHDTFTLVLHSEQRFKFRAGQFCFLRLNKNKLYARHPFTISSSPADAELCFTIKQSGRFTAAAARLKIGEEVIVDGPFGIFTLHAAQKDLVFIAGGVGITPFFSMIRDHLQNNKTQNILLLYGSKTAADIIFRRALDQVKQTWFQKVYVLSESVGSEQSCEKGDIDAALLQKYIKNLANTSFYICGPTPLKNAVKKILLERGVCRRAIFIEDFFW